MSRQVPDEPRRCPGVTRRSFLADTGMGFTGLALGAMLAREGARACGRPRCQHRGPARSCPRPRRSSGSFSAGASAMSRASTPSPN